jgi:hypothetical protein
VNSIEAALCLIAPDGSGAAGWSRYYAGVIAGLLRDSERASREFDRLLAEPAQTPWEEQRAQRTQELRALLKTPTDFIAEIGRIVAVRRRGLGLPDCAAPFG